MLHGQMSQRGHVTLIDKKTILRNLQSLEQRGFISSLPFDKMQNLYLNVVYPRSPRIVFYLLNLNHVDAERFCQLVGQVDNFHSSKSLSIPDRIDQFIQHAYQSQMASKKTSDDEDDQEEDEALDDSDSEASEVPSRKSQTRRLRTPRKDLFGARDDSDDDTDVLRGKRKKKYSTFDIAEESDEYQPPGTNHRASARRRSSVNSSSSMTELFDSSQHEVAEGGSSRKKRRTSAVMGTETLTPTVSQRKRSASAVSASATASEALHNDEMEMLSVRLVGVVVTDEAAGKADASKSSFVPLSVLLKQPSDSVSASNTSVQGVISAVRNILTSTTRSNVVTVHQLRDMHVSDEHWTIDEDLQLLERLILSLFTRSGRLGLPKLLKPIFWRIMVPHLSHIVADNHVSFCSKIDANIDTDAIPGSVDSAGLSVYRRDDYAQFVWNSAPQYIDIDYAQFDATQLRPTYLLSTSIKTSNMSVSACRRHLPILFRYLCQFTDNNGSLTIGGTHHNMMTGHLSLRSLLARFLFYRGDICQSYAALLDWKSISAFKVVSSEKQSAKKAAAAGNKNYNTTTASAFDALGFIDIIRFLLWQHQQQSTSGHNNTLPIQDHRAQKILQRIFKVRCFDNIGNSLGSY